MNCVAKICYRRAQFMYMVLKRVRNIHSTSSKGDSVGRSMYIVHGDGVQNVCEMFELGHIARASVALSKAQGREEGAGMEKKGFLRCIGFVYVRTELGDI